MSLSKRCGQGEAMRGLGKTGDLVELSFDSAVAPGLPYAVLQRLARHTLEVNPRLGLTGELRLERDRFVAVIEGRSEVVLPLAARILSDGRHAAIRLSAFGPIDGRRFDGWRVTGFGVDDAAVPAAANLRYLVTGSAAAGTRFAPRGQLGALTL
jgi:Sensors of blue-light using FAD